MSGSRAQRRGRAGWVALGLWCLALAACNREPRALGDDCTRSSECEQGLVCIDQACSDDLGALGDRGGSVPMLMPDEETPVEAGADAGAMGEPAADAATEPGAGPADSGP